MLGLCSIYSVYKNVEYHAENKKMIPSIAEEKSNCWGSDSLLTIIPRLSFSRRPSFAFVYPTFGFQIWCISCSERTFCSYPKLWYNSSWNTVCWKIRLNIHDIIGILGIKNLDILRLSYLRASFCMTIYYRATQDQLSLSRQTSYVPG